MPRAVAIVFDSDYSASLEKLAFTTPVWLVETAANRTAAEEVGHIALEWPHMTVTLFRGPDGEPGREDWKALLEQIAFRERFVETIDVIGSPLSEVARDVLVGAGFGRFEAMPNGFRAKR